MSKYILVGEGQKRKKNVSSILLVERRGISLLYKKVE